MTNISADPHVNNIRLVGRVSRDPVVRELPSGDAVVNVQLVVNRPRDDDSGSRATFDAIPCSSWNPEIQGTMRDWSPGDVVEVTGSLRRRFWRGEGGVQNTFEVEVGAATVVEDADEGALHKGTHQGASPRLRAE